MATNREPIQAPPGITVLDTFNPNADQTVYEGPYTATYTEGVQVPNATLSINGQLSLDGGIDVTDENNQCTIVFTVIIADTIAFSTPQCNSSQELPNKDVLQPPCLPCYLIPSSAVPPGAYNIPVHSQKVRESSSFDTYSYGCAYAQGVLAANFNKLTTIAVLPDINSFTVQLTLTEDLENFDTVTTTGPFSYTPLVPVWRPGNSPGTYINSVTNCYDESNWLLDPGLDALYGPLRPLPVDTPVPYIDYVYGMGWYRGDVGVSQYESNAHWGWYPDFGGTPVSAEFDAYQGFMSPPFSSNSTLAHQDFYVREMCFIIDDTVAQKTPPNGVYFFPINNTPDSAMNLSLTEPNSPYQPVIGNTFLPFYNRGGGNLYHAFWPTPVDQIVMNSPNGFTSPYGQLQNFSSSGVPLGVAGQARNQSAFFSSAVADVNDASLTYAVQFPDTGPLGRQAFWGACDFPMSYPAQYQTTQIQFNLPASVNGLLDDTYLPFTPCTPVPVGVASQGRRCASFRYLFPWLEDENAPGEYTKLMTFKKVIKIEKGRYTQPALILAIQKAIDEVDENGESAFVRYIDCYKQSILFTATDEAGEETPWSKPFINSQDPDDRNNFSPSRIGHKGRGVRVTAGPNIRFKAGSSSVALVVSPDNGLLQITGLFDPFVPSNLLSTSGLTANTPSSCSLPYSYSVAIGDPPNCGDYGYTQFIPGNPAPTFQETPVDPDFQSLTYMLGGYDVYSVNYQAVQWPSPISRDISPYTTSLAQHYKSQTLTLVTNQRGIGVTYPTKLTGPIPIHDVRNTKPLYFLPESLGSNVNLNPWTRANLSGPNGVCLLSLCDGSKKERNFWALLGFNPDRLETMFEPDILKIRPVEGVAYNPNEEEYVFHPELFCVSNQTPYLYHQLSNTAISIMPVRAGETQFQTLTNFVLHLPVYNCSISTTGSITTNCPMMLTPAFYDATLMTETNHLPFYNYFPGMLDMQVNVIPSWPFFDVSPRSDQVVIDEWNVPASVVYAMNPYCMHDGWGYILTRTNLPQSPDTVWNTLDPVSGNPLQCLSPGIQVPSNPVAQPRSTFIQGSYWSYTQGAAGISVSHTDVHFGLQTWEGNSLIIPTYSNFDITAPSKPSPTYDTFYHRNLNYQDARNCTGLTVGNAGIIRQLPQAPTDANFAPYCTVNNIPTFCLAPDQLISVSNLITKANSVSTRRIPKAGRCHVDTVATWYFNQAPCLPHRGFMGLPIKPQLAANTDFSTTTASEAHQPDLVKMGHESKVIAIIRNYSSSARGGSLFNASTFYSDTTGIQALNTAFPKTSTQPINNFNGQDFSEPVQIQPTFQYIIADIQMKLFGTIQSEGVFLLGIRGPVLNSPNHSYVKGKPIRNFFKCAVDPINSDTLQVLTFQCDYEIQVPAHTFHETRYQVLDLDGNEVEGIQSLRIFLNFTPLNGPTALQYAFAAATPLTQAQTQSAPNITALGPNAFATRAAPPLSLPDPPQNVQNGQPKRGKIGPDVLVPDWAQPNTGIPSRFARQNF